MPNNLLSILIPTYNRADFLDCSLTVHIPLLEKYNIQIIIFDNASTDHTQEVVNKWSEKYPYLTYHKHEENIGGIGNFEYALQYPSTEYVWMLGDTYQIEPGVIEKVLSVLNISNQKPDGIILNLDSKVTVDSSLYSDSNELLRDLGGLTTCIAVSIFKKEMVTEDILLRYKNVWFTHMAIIFESIKNDNFTIFWLQEYSVIPLIHETIKKSNWSHTPKVFEIGCKDWTDFVMSLPPSYKLENKMKCLLDFGKISKLFSFKGLVGLRIQGLLNIKVFCKYRKFFYFTVDAPLLLILLVTITPIFLLKIIKAIIKR